MILLDFCHWKVKLYIYSHWKIAPFNHPWWSHLIMDVAVSNCFFWGSNLYRFFRIGNCWMNLAITWLKTSSRHSGFMWKPMKLQILQVSPKRLQRFCPFLLKGSFDSREDDAWHVGQRLYGVLGEHRMGKGWERYTSSGSPGFEGFLKHEF